MYYVYFFNQQNKGGFMSVSSMPIRKKDMKNMFNYLLFLLALVLITGLLMAKVHKQLGAETKQRTERSIHKRTSSVPSTVYSEKTQNTIRSTNKRITQYDKIEIAGAGADTWQGRENVSCK